MIQRAELTIDSLVVDPMQSREQPWTGDDIDQQLTAAIDADGLYNERSAAELRPGQPHGHAWLPLSGYFLV